MRYFEKFPTLLYTFDKEKLDMLVARDIFTRVRMLDSVINNLSVYYTYQMKDSDTLESIAHKYYGDINKFWIISFTNTLLDPFFDIPLNYTQFLEYLTSKYGSPETAQTIIDHYEKRITNTTTSSSQVTTTSTVAYIANNTYSIDGSTTLPTIQNPVITAPSPPDSVIGNLTISTEIIIVAVSAYDAEVELNDNKRNIKLIKKEYAAQVESELIKLLEA